MRRNGSLERTFARSTSLFVTNQDEGSTAGVAGATPGVASADCSWAVVSVVAGAGAFCSTTAGAAACSAPAGAVVLGAVSVGAVVFGAVSVGAVVFGAVSVGALVVGAVSVRALAAGAEFDCAAWPMICLDFSSFIIADGAATASAIFTVR